MLAKSNAKKNASQPPKRKIGRYVLLFALALPLFTQLRHLDIHLPEVELPSFNMNSEVEFTNVIVDGDLVYSNKETLRHYLTEQVATDFLRLDLDDIQASLLQNSWYRNVAVSRVWPSSLKVVIEEEQPIARWGNEGFINRYGEVVLSENVESLDRLPLLMGANDQAYDIAKSYLTMSQLMVSQQLYITKLSVSDSGDWSLEINHDFQLALGDRDVSSRIERFLFLYGKQLAPLTGEFERVDMRYQSGVAVKWKKQALTAIAVRNNIASR